MKDFLDAAKWAAVVGVGVGFSGGTFVFALRYSRLGKLVLPAVDPGIAQQILPIEEAKKVPGAPPLESNMNQRIEEIFGIVIGFNKNIGSELRSIRQEYGGRISNVEAVQREDIRDVRKELATARDQRTEIIRGFSEMKAAVGDIADKVGKIESKDQAAERRDNGHS